MVYIIKFALSMFCICIYYCNSKKKKKRLTLNFSTWPGICFFNLKFCLIFHFYNCVFSFMFSNNANPLTHPISKSV